MKNLFSKFLSINFRDIAKGFLMAILGAALGLVYGIVQSGELTFDWAFIWKSSLAAGISYLLKNFFTNSKDEFLTKEKE